MVQGFDTVLDRPVWSALNGPQAALAQGGSTAMRIDPGYGPFAAAAPGHERELAALLRDVDDEIWLVEDGAVMPPPGTAVRKTARLAQMLATGPDSVYARTSRSGYQAQYDFARAVNLDGDAAILKLPAVKHQAPL